jgi:hypothetical protein
MDDAMSLFDRLFGKRSGAPATSPARSGPEVRASGPPTCTGNPGSGTSGRVAFSNSERNWMESFDLMRIATDVLMARGHALVAHESWIELDGFVLQPLLAELTPLEDGGVRTTTTMDVRHPTLVPDGLFEYQHATGDDTVQSLAKGLENWADADLPVLLDALRAKPETCTVLEMTFPAKDGLPARTRRALLGGVTAYAKDPRAEVTACGPDGEHSFCGCCLLTRNFEAFRQYVEADRPYGIRFYAARSAEEKALADCRINGEDYEPGMESLRAYVATWPGTGFEFRKQFVFIHTTAASAS